MPWVKQAMGARAITLPPSVPKAVSLKKNENSASKNNNNSHNFSNPMSLEQGKETRDPFQKEEASVEIGEDIQDDSNEEMESDFRESVTLLPLRFHRVEHALPVNARGRSDTGRGKQQQPKLKKQKVQKTKKT